MEQLYYTQCPLGYGLGTSNGAQVKRRSPGYPPSSDLRFLGLRAFLADADFHALAPPALRYRRLGLMAEVAWLTPRTLEYETERGAWGRPGGHFAHALLLDGWELSALECWPAGLFDRPFWRRSDPWPTGSESTDELVLGRSDLMVPPTFESVASLVAETARSPEILARMLSALAEAIRNNATLTIVDAPDRLGRLVALLTLAFPGPLRRAVTFSTFHDRPEELPGLRLQGTAPRSRTERVSLAALGPVVDLVGGRAERGKSPDRWAQRLTDWFIEPDERAAAGWDEFERRLQARESSSSAALWSRACLESAVISRRAAPARRPIARRGRLQKTSKPSKPADPPRAVRPAISRPIVRTIAGLAFFVAAILLVQTEGESHRRALREREGAAARSARAATAGSVGERTGFKPVPSSRSSGSLELQR